jgi:hypothetical protein
VPCKSKPGQLNACSSLPSCERQRLPLVLAILRNGSLQYLILRVLLDFTLTQISRPTLLHTFQTPGVRMRDERAIPKEDMSRTSFNDYSDHNHRSASK